MATQCHWRGVGHVYSHRLWNRRATRLRIATGGLSALAGSVLLAGADPPWSIAAGACGLAAALLTVVERALTPGPLAQQHLDAHRAFTALGGELWQLAKTPPDDVGEARARLRELGHARAEAERISVAAEQWAHEKATAELEEVKRAHEPEAPPDSE